MNFAIVLVYGSHQPLLMNYLEWVYGDGSDTQTKRCSIFSLKVIVKLWFVNNIVAIIRKGSILPQVCSPRCSGL